MIGDTIGLDLGTYSYFLLAERSEVSPKAEHFIFMYPPFTIPNVTLRRQ